MRSFTCRLVITMLAVFAMSATAAFAEDTRCGFSTGAVLGVNVPQDTQVHHEFDFIWQFEVNAKYYLFWGVSLAAGTGYQYGKGKPDRYYVDGDWRGFDSGKLSYWKAWPSFGTLRVEFWRRGIWNPYIGAGGGITYLDIYRKGVIFHEKAANSGREWVPTYFGLAGFDIALGKYVAYRFEGRYRSMQTSDEFFDKLDFGGWDILTGVNVYF